MRALTVKVRKLFTAPIRFYRRHLSYRKRAPCCKYLPTCSEYAIEAIEEWGIFCGSALAIWRILRCNPFSSGGYDPVPARGAKRAKSSAKSAKSAGKEEAKDVESRKKTD